MGSLTWIINAIIILAVIGVGWENLFADNIGITSLLENATNSATDNAENASRDIIGSSLGK